MKKKKIVNAVTALAVSLSICCMPGNIPYTNISVITQTSAADSSITFDSASGTLFLSGEIDYAEIRNYPEKDVVKSIVAKEGTIFPENCNYLFIEFSSATTIDLSKANTSKVTDMSGMFLCCNNAESIDLSNFDTSNVKDMNDMFGGCRALKKINLSSFDTSNVRDMSSMFSGCQTLSSIDVSVFNTSKVIDMSWMFADCTSLLSLDLSGLDTSNVIDMSWMFGGCT